MDKRVLIVVFIFVALMSNHYPGFCQQTNTTLAPVNQSAENQSILAEPGNPSDVANNFLTVFDKLQGWDPFFEIETLQKKMHRMFEDSFSKGLKRERAFLRKISFFEPNLNVKDTDAAYIISADLPGMEKDKINVEIKGNLLMISGERKANESAQD